MNDKSSWWIHIDAPRKLTYARMLGVVTYEHIRDMQSATRVAPKFDPSFGFLFDITHISAWDVTWDEFKSLTHLTSQAKATRRAILVERSHVFGIGRMYEAAHDATGALPVLVCESVAEAATWLGIPDLAGGIAAANLAHKVGRESVVPAARDHNVRRRYDV